MSSDHAKVVVVSGPTASGKSTLWQRLVEHPRVDFSVSATTRPPRDGEEDGRDYRFLSQEEFDALVAEDAFLEHATVHGRSYGTLRADVEKSLEAGHHVVLEIDVQGADQVRESGLPQVSLFIQPPSLEVLRERLLARGTEDPEEMDRRLEVVEEEMAQSDQYDHVVVNDDLDAMIAEVEDILGLRQKA